MVLRALKNHDKTRQTLGTVTGIEGHVWILLGDSILNLRRPGGHVGDDVFVGRYLTNHRTSLRGAKNGFESLFHVLLDVCI